MVHDALRRYKLMWHSRPRLCIPSAEGSPSTRFVRLGCMPTQFPSAVPEIPVANVEKAAGYYVNVLGFHFDWGNDEGGIGGISQGDCRIFLTNTPFHKHYGTG